MHLMNLSPAFTPSIFLLVFLLLVQHALAAAPTVSVITVEAPRATNAPSFVDDGDFIASVLNSTNFYRYEHGALPLAWNNSLQEYAQNWTEPCKFAHSGGPSGENLAEGYNSVQLSIEAWGNERVEYDFNNQGFSEATGHFTQLVWTTSRTVGCGRKFCQSGVGGWYLVCEYWPAGNVIGSFSQHVKPQSNDGTGYVFQNCTLTGNCTTLVPGAADGDDGDGDGNNNSSSSGGEGGGSSSGSGGSGGGGKSDGSKVYVGPIMAVIILAATGLTLWEPWLLYSDPL